jgi:hypothetical protein
MTEATEVAAIEPVVAPVEAADDTPVVPEPVEALVDESTIDPTREPGGDEPDNAYQRKRTRELNHARQEAERLRLEKAELEGRYKALQEQKQTQQEERVFTIAEVNEAVEQGRVTRRDADAYIQSTVIPYEFKQLRKKEVEQERLTAPVEKARNYVNEYIEVMPQLADTTSREFTAVARKYQELVADGHHSDYRTQRLALDYVYGDLERLKRKRSLESRPTPTIPVDVGGRAQVPSGKVDVSKAPPEFQEMWRMTGTPPDAQERQLKIYLAKQAAKQR